MAELITPEKATDPCCAPEAQATCCEPSAKAECCGQGEGCGCAAGEPAGDVRERVRERYASGRPCGERADGLWLRGWRDRRAGTRGLRRRAL